MIDFPIMKKPFLKFVLFGGATAFIIGLVALGYTYSTRPESDYATRLSVDGFSELYSTRYSSFEEWDQAVKEWASARLLEPLVLSSERGDFVVTLTALGVEPDWAALDEELKFYMEESSRLEKLQLYFIGSSVSIPLKIDPFKLENTLAFSGFEQSEKNAQFTYENGTLSIIPQQLGYQIQTEPLLDFLNESLTAPASFTLTLQSKEPEVLDQELENLRATVEPLASMELKLKDSYGNEWTLTIAEFGSWIVPAEPALEATTVQSPSWTLEEAAFISYAEAVLSPEVEEDPQGVVITENPDGTYSFEGSARFGKELDKTLLKQSIETALQTAQGEEAIPLPIIEIEPNITVPDSLKARGVTDLVGMGYSDFSGSPYNRIHNIKVGIDLYDGLIIEQGAEFSFMEHMPAVNAANGFLPELVIKGDETIPEYGGGLCQVSSTMFRAALYSGLPITERRNHSYAVAYYARPFGYGLDATIYDPAPDLKFANDTPADILVQAYIDGNSAYYVFYGTNDGRTVSMDGPYSYNYRSIPPAVTTYTSLLSPGVRQLESYGHTGFTTDWYRTVTYVTPTQEQLDDPSFYVSPYMEAANGVKELIRSIYEARPAKYLEGEAGAVEEAPSTVEG